mmetsp:Transcript_2995/g.4280  ORF Transcript_2995/g.4280 Transcript_2995/m.4280 type:complete len:759 (-) Transcript_2995:246-2522(-)|eukprot:CAMPEP_0117745058 /NCGR_PEP_ID=MMETSP0947-20121206/7131_1 /TAXON_ID=44440 /ORGANISM="Chattonella subsalsa, Strain CCMP2191" /LENGTH=758 /DNA_ID=CAMNT_0005562131 /DNA_START=68 /DNA_END=2344 /DNA_ORIENTATION=+
MQRKLSGTSFGLKPAASRNNAAGAKKMVIKPFKVKPQLPVDFEEQTWQKLQQSVVAVFSNQPAAQSREELYRAVEDMCIHKMAPKLYERLERTCEGLIEKSVDKLVGITMDPAVFLAQAGEVWQGHTDHVLTLRNIFLYLDRGYILQAANLRSIWDMGLDLFRTHLQSRQEVESKIIGGILQQIEAERNGEDVNRDLLKSLLRMLWSLGLYSSSFEGRFLDETSLFYTKEGARYIETTDTVHFLVHCENRLAAESDRVGHYLDAQTLRPLITTVETKLIAPHALALMDRGFEQLMTGDRVDDLRRMYKLFGKPGVSVLEDLKAALNNYVRRKGLELVNDDGGENAKLLIDRLLVFKSKQDAIMENAFEKNQQYTFALKDAWEHFLNAKQNKPAELLAKFVDAKLKGQKGSTDNEIETLLDKVMVLFRFLHAKDVFEAFYKKDLAKRLLLGKSSSFDLERSMISKLKTECGAAFTTKLEGMFKDIDLSRDLMSQYQQYQNDRDEQERESNVFEPHSANSVEMAVQVLTTGYWPTYPPMAQLKLPSELVYHQERFRKYYTSKYQGRRIEWQHILGQCIVKALCFKKTKELSVSQLQAMVLMCFNYAEKIQFPDVKEQTGIEDGELRRTLQSLACGKVRVLTKQPKGREVEDSDSFVINSDFSHKLYRIKINTIQMKETVEENEKTHEAVFRDRQYQVDAAIVRIMKSRKTLSHPLLMSELFNQLKFPAKPADLKKRIESLIEREYLERDENKSSVYNYLA